MTTQTSGRWALAGAIAFMAIAGCGQPPDQFIIVQNQVPTAGCVIPTTLGSVYRATGILDVSLVFDGRVTGYEIFPVLQNNLSPPVGSDSGDPNRIALSSYQVEVALMGDAPEGAITQMFEALKTSGPDGTPDLKVAFSQPTSGSVASGGGNTSSGVIGVPADLARAIRETRVLETALPFHVMSTIRAVGKTITRSVTSDPFHYPILVCDGCLVATIDQCPFSAAPANPGNVCNVAQDEAVDCCVGSSGLVCPPPVATSAAQ